jgi:uncharacterized protein with GYD domain
MAHYIMLWHFTDRGLGNLKSQGPKRIDAVKKAFKDRGAELKEWYSVMGRYDTVLVVEAPDDETMAKVALGIEAMGNARSETLRAFNEQEYRKIIAAL